MKQFETVLFNAREGRKELTEFSQLLQRPHLNEREEILRFFRQRKHLSVSINLFHPYISEPNLLAYEYDLFGDFSADLVIGDQASGNYLLVEFENAAPDSLFKAVGDKVTPEWSRRYEQSFSQVVDWFWKLSDSEHTTDFRNRFGQGYTGFQALIVIGRLQGLSDREFHRFKWRREQISVGSKKIHVVTFDELYKAIDDSLRRYERAFQTDINQ
jgi:hypothetical protein